MSKPTENGQSKIYEGRHFEDSAGRTIEVLLDEETLRYRAKGFMSIKDNRGNQMSKPLTFFVEAESLEEAFGLFDETAKIEAKKIVGKMNTPSILTPGQIFPRPPRN